MKKHLIALLAAALVIWTISPCQAAPKAVPVNPVFEFSPLAEGQGITHEFVIKNDGDTELNIIGVIPP